MAMTLAPEDKNDIVARLSRLEEPWILSYFWLLVKKDADRRELLELLTHVIVQRPPKWNPAAIRRDHDASIATFGIGGLERACFVCRTTARRLYVHHVVEVQHGGSNDPKNRVALCFPCHQHLHPWLETEPVPLKRAGWESMSEIGARALAWLLNK